MIDASTVVKVQSTSVIIQDFDTTTNVIGTEWWNGQGIDFAIKREDSECQINLTSDEIITIAGIALRFGYLDLEEIESVKEKIK